MLYKKYLHRLSLPMCVSVYIVTNLQQLIQIKIYTLSGTINRKYCDSDRLLQHLSLLFCIHIPFKVSHSRHCHKGMNLVFKLTFDFAQLESEAIVIYNRIYHKILGKCCNSLTIILSAKGIGNVQIPQPSFFVFRFNLSATIIIIIRLLLRDNAVCSTCALLSVCLSLANCEKTMHHTHTYYTA